jgi:hypothetical protein
MISVAPLPQTSLRRFILPAVALFVIGLLPQAVQSNGPIAGLRPSETTSGTTRVASGSGTNAAYSSVALQAVTLRVSQLPPAERRALQLLCQRLAGATGAHGQANQHAFGSVQEIPLTGVLAKIFQRQWSRAARASAALATPAEARAAGYAQASPFHAGVGTHWVKWSLVGKPFDPAAPSMLLFDGMPGRPNRLVGFSYWVGSFAEPAGFAGPNDHWHRHLSLCFDVDGWLTTQSGGDGACQGFSLNGQSLWMLHAWVVPGASNPWGRFAPANLSLCPPQSVPDVLQCQF